MSNGSQDLDSTITLFLAREDLSAAQEKELILLLLKKLSARMDRVEKRTLLDDPEYKRLKYTLHGAWAAVSLVFGVLVWLFSKGYLSVGT